MHELIIHETAGVFRRGEMKDVTVSTDPPGISLRAARPRTSSRSACVNGTYGSPVVRLPFPFNEVVPSWNVDGPPDSGFAVELRVGRRRGNFWTPFYALGSWGPVSGRRSRRLRDRHCLVNIDYLRSDRYFDRLQYRVRLCAEHPAFSPVVRRIVLACSDTIGAYGPPRPRRVSPGRKEKWARRLPVPFRSQKDAHPDIRWSVCSPTSTAMVMSYYGVDRPTSLMARVIYDRANRIYGNWWRAVQGAYTFGVPGYLERFGDWNGVKRHIAHGRPVIASIRVGKSELRGAPYRSSAGHLLVITGVDRDGNVHVNDPAAATARRGITTYAREDMEKVWFERRGVGYVLLPPGTTASTTR